MLVFTEAVAAIGTDGKLNVSQFMETLATQGADTLHVGAGLTFTPSRPLTLPLMHYITL